MSVDTPTLVLVTIATAFGLGVMSIVLTFFQAGTRGMRHWGVGIIGLGVAYTLIHLVGIPITNLSVNPARSTGPAVFVGGWALAQLWLFWVAPILGGAVGGVLYRWLSPEPSALVTGTETGTPVSDRGRAGAEAI